MIESCACFKIPSAVLKYKLPNEVIHLDGVRSMQPCVCYSASQFFCAKQIGVAESKVAWRGVGRGMG